MGKIAYKPGFKRNIFVEYGTAVVVLTVILFSRILPSSTCLASKDPYDSGYEDSCDDARISDPSERYYNQPEKGPSFHTNAFNSGYNDVGMNIYSLN